jgi:spore maturation protein A
VIHLIWLLMILSGILVAGMQGKIEVINEAVFEGAKTGVTISLGLISILTLWLGLMKIAEEAGLLQALGNLLRPVVRFLFPSVPPGHPAEGYILSNLTANLFGLGNAATPMGLAAMKELQTLNPKKEIATPAMCTLLALNTSGLTLIPTTIIGIRMTYQSANPTEIIGTTLAATFIATISAICIDKWFQWREQRQNGEKS